MKLTSISLMVLFFLTIHSNVNADDTTLKEAYAEATVLYADKKYPEALKLYKKLLKQLDFEEEGKWTKKLSQRLPELINKIQKKLGISVQTNNDSQSKTKSKKDEARELLALYNKIKKKSDILIQQEKFDEAIQILEGLQISTNTYKSNKHYKGISEKIVKLINNVIKVKKIHIEVNDRAAKRESSNEKKYRGSTTGDGSFSTVLSPTTVIRDYSNSTQSSQNTYLYFGNTLSEYLEWTNFKSYSDVLNKPQNVQALAESNSDLNTQIKQNRKLFKLHTKNYDLSYSGFLFGSDIIDSLKNIEKVQNKYKLINEIYATNNRGSFNINPNYTFPIIWDRVVDKTALLDLMARHYETLSLGPDSISLKATYENTVQTNMRDIRKTSLEYELGKYILAGGDIDIIFPTKLMGELYKCTLSFSVNPNITAYHVLNEIEPYNYVLDKDGNKHFGVEYLTQIRLELLNDKLTEQDISEMSDAIYNAFSKKFPYGKKRESKYRQLETQYNNVHLKIIRHGYGADRLSITMKLRGDALHNFGGALETLKAKVSAENEKNSSISDDI